MDMDLHNRRTIRKYASTPVSDKLLKDLLQLAARSSNTGNMQTYSVVVTRDEKKKELLSPAHFNQPMVKQAPVVLTFCADYNRFTEWCKCRQAEPGYDNFQSFIASAIDAIVWAQTFAVAAEREGLGICYLGTTTYNAHQIIEVLNLPRLVIPIVTLTLGYPEDMPELQDRWHAEKEALPAMKQFVAENNKETLAQVFTDVRYTKKNNEYFSDVLLEVLKKPGFLA